MYKPVATDNSCYTTNGSSFLPVATLADEHGGRCQISIDDHCYVIKLKQEDDLYKNTNHIFNEVFEVLKYLPNPI